MGNDKMKEDVELEEDEETEKDKDIEEKVKEMGMEYNNNDLEDDDANSGDYEGL